MVFFIPGLAPPLRPARGEPSSRARACRPGRVGENRPRGGRELLSRTGKQTDWEEPPIESKTQLNTQIGGIEVGRLRVAERSVAERLLSAVYVQIFVKGWQGHFGCCLQYATVAHSQIPVLTAV